MVKFRDGHFGRSNHEVDHKAGSFHQIRWPGSAGLKKRPRFVCHFVPTCSSWLNLVDRWFRELIDKAIRRGSFVSLPDLKRTIDEFLNGWNEDPRPFIFSFS